MTNRKTEEDTPIVEDTPIEEVAESVKKEPVGELRLQRFLAEAQSESKKRKVKIKALNEEIVSKDAEILKLKGHDSKINALEATIKATKIKKEMKKMGVSKDAAEVIRPLLEGQVSIDPETFKAKINEDTLKRLKVLFPKKEEVAKPSTLQHIFKRPERGKEAVTALDRLLADANALQGRKK